MADVGAVARVRQAGGDIARTIEGVRAGARDLTREVDGVTDEQERATKTAEDAYRRLSAQQRAAQMSDMELQRSYRGSSAIIADRSRMIESMTRNLRAQGLAESQAPSGLANARAKLEAAEIEREAASFIMQQRGLTAQATMTAAQGVAANAAAASAGPGGAAAGGAAGPQPAPPGGHATAPGGAAGGGGGAGGGGPTGFWGGAIKAFGGGGPSVARSGFLFGLGFEAAEQAIRMIGQAWNYAEEAARMYQNTQTQVFQTGLVIGGHWKELREQAEAAQQSGLHLTFAETLESVRALSTRTGRTDIGGMAGFARAYGLPVAGTVSMFAEMGRLGVMPTRDRIEIPFISSAREFGGDRFKQTNTFPRGVMHERYYGPSRPLGASPVTRMVMRGHGIEDVLARGYADSPWAMNGNAQSLDYLQTVRALLQVQGEGGAPIRDFGVMPAMLNAAGEIYGKDVAPQFGAQIVAGLVGGLSGRGGNDTLRGIHLRAIMQMSAEERTGIPYDLNDPIGALAALQTAPTNREWGSRVMQAALRAQRRYTGANTPYEHAVMTDMMGGRADLGIRGSQYADWVLSAGAAGVPKGTEPVDFQKMFADAMVGAGGEGKAWEQGMQKEEMQQRIGQPLAHFYEAINEAVLDFAGKLRGLREQWDSSGLGAMSSSVPMSRLP